MVVRVLVTTYPGDDTLLLVPKVLGDVEERPFASAVLNLFAPDPMLPNGLWKAYVVLTWKLFGPTHPPFVLVGVGLHLLSSVLVWAFARRLGLSRGAAWVAAALHATAYPGFHAHVWPVGVQHVLTVLLVLAVLTLYLLTEQRRRAGLPISLHYPLTALVAIVGSATRTTSLTAPLAILVHAAFTSARDDDRRGFDLWAPVALASTLYPLATIVYLGEGDVPELFPALGHFLAGLLMRMPALVAYVYAVTLATLALVAVRALLVSRRLKSALAAPRARRLVVAAILVAASPLIVRLLLVFVWGVEHLLTPLPLALNSYNTARWHMTVAPFDLVGLGLGVAAVALFGVRRQGRDAVILLTVPFASFGTMFFGLGWRPNRYWIYVTPVLAIVVAAAAEQLWRRAGAGAYRPWLRAGILAATGLVIATNIAAVRLELWRHRLTDVFLVLDYVRAAELIRADLQASGPGAAGVVCVNGLEAPPNDPYWREAVQYPRSFRDHNATVILAQALGIRDLRRIRLDCPDGLPDARIYTVTGGGLTRAGRAVDPSEAASVRVRDLLQAGRFEEARAAADAAGARPFGARYLLGGAPDEDIDWITNGVSVFEWVDRLAANHDHWSGPPDLKVRFLGALLEAEMAAYVRLVFLREYATARLNAPTTLWDVRHALAAHRLRFRMATMNEIVSAVRAEPLLASDPAMMTFLENVVATSPTWRPTRDSMDFGSLRSATTVTFYAFLFRLIWSDLGLPIRAAS